MILYLNGCFSLLLRFVVYLPSFLSSVVEILIPSLGFLPCLYLLWGKGLNCRCRPTTDTTKPGDLLPSQGTPHVETPRPPSAHPFAVRGPPSHRLWGTSTHGDPQDDGRREVDGGRSPRSVLWPWSYLGSRVRSQRGRGRWLFHIGTQVFVSFSWEQGSSRYFPLALRFSVFNYCRVCFFIFLFIYF